MSVYSQSSGNYSVGCGLKTIMLPKRHALYRQWLTWWTGELFHKNEFELCQHLVVFNSAVEVAASVFAKV